MGKLSTVTPGSGLPSASGPFVFLDWDPEQGRFVVPDLVAGDKIAPTALVVDGELVSGDNPLPFYAAETVAVNLEGVGATLGNPLSIRLAYFDFNIGNYAEVSKARPMPVNTRYEGDFIVSEVRVAAGISEAVTVFSGYIQSARMLGFFGYRMFIRNDTDVTLDLELVEVIASVEKVTPFTVLVGATAELQVPVAVDSIQIRPAASSAVPNTGSYSVGGLAY